MVISTKGRLFLVSRLFAGRMHQIGDLKKCFRAQCLGWIHENYQKSDQKKRHWAREQYPCSLSAALQRSWLSSWSLKRAVQPQILLGDEPLQEPQAGVDQVAERETCNHVVAGSKPVSVASFFCFLFCISRLNWVTSRPHWRRDVLREVQKRAEKKGYACRKKG